MSAPRVASLLPSATEIVCALGLEAQLVGRSHECDFPPSVQALPIFTEAKLDPEASSREIDDRVTGLNHKLRSIIRKTAPASSKMTISPATRPTCG